MPPGWHAVCGGAPERHGEQPADARRMRGSSAASHRRTCSWSRPHARPLHLGRVDRISPEAPVPVVHVTHETVHLGGAANVVHNIRALGGHATACGVVGADADGRRLLDELKAIGPARRAWS